MENQDPARHEVEAEARDAALDARELSIRDREATQGARARETQGILDDADKRDDLADARDSAAEKRDTAASLASFLSDGDGVAGLKARRSAGLDRVDAKSDRDLSAGDRARLARPSDTAEPARPKRAATS